MNYIKNCNCVDGMKNLEDESVDLTVTIPPYDNLRKYKDYTFDFPSVAKELYRITKNGGVVVWVVADSTIKGSETGTSFKQALFFKECGFCLYDTMIWRKPNPSVPTESRYYNAFEYMFVFSKGKPKTLNLICDRPNKGAGKTYSYDSKMNPELRGKDPSRLKTVGEFSRRHNVWDIPIGVNKTKHPAVFPLQLAKDHILSWSNDGDIVLDPFMGSGTTAVAAIETGRKYIGFEISKDYCEIADERIRNLDCRH